MLIPVSVGQVVALNYAAVQKNQARPMPARWKPVHAGNQGRGFGPSVGIFDPNCQSCDGQLVIPPYCPPPPPPTPDQAAGAQAIKQAVIDALRESPPIVTEASPIESPGYRGERKLVANTWVINGSGAGAVAAGAALLAAVGGPAGATALGITNVQVVNTGYTALNTFTVPSSKFATVERLSFSANALNASQTLFFTVFRSGRAVVTEFQFTSQDTVELDFPANADDVVTVMVRNPDTTGAWIVSLGLSLWTTPNVNRTDGLYGKVMRQNPGNPLPVARDWCDRPVGQMVVGRN